MLRTNKKFTAKEIKFSSTQDINVFIGINEDEPNPLPADFEVLF